MTKAQIEELFHHVVWKNFSWLKNLTELVDQYQTEVTRILSKTIFWPSVSVTNDWSSEHMRMWRQVPPLRASREIKTKFWTKAKTCAERVAFEFDKQGWARPIEV
jgi:hypothetical protein